MFQLFIFVVVSCMEWRASSHTWVDQKEMKNTTNWRRWKRIQSRPQGWRGVWAEKAEAALQKWRESDEGFKRCAKVRAIHAETLRLGCKICNSKEKVNYRDMWCPRNDCMTKNTRGFGHPQGMIYVGKSGRFVYLPIPKVASTTLRKWSVAAYKEEAEETEAKWLLPDSEKAIADRLLGMAMWHDVPRAVRAKTAAFALVRDPLERFSSALKELFAYEKGPQERRTWGRHVLRRQHFFAQAAKRSSNASAISLFASGGVIRVRKELEIVIGDAVRDLACDPDWNEHLTPQRLFFPDKFLAAGPAIAPSINIVALLPSAARTAGLDHELAKNFAIAGNKLNSVTSKQKMNIHTNAREGWPQPNDIRPALDHADEYTQSGLISTRYLWCWLYAIDYTSFPFFETPPWCDDAYSSAGVVHPGPFQRRQSAFASGYRPQRMISDTVPHARATTTWASRLVAASNPGDLFSSS